MSDKDTYSKYSSYFDLPSAHDLAHIEQIYKDTIQSTNYHDLLNSLKPETYIDSFKEISKFIESNNINVNIDNTIAKLSNDTKDIVSKLKSDVQEKDKLVKQLQLNVDNIKKELSLKHLLSQVTYAARQRLIQDDDFYQLFESNKECQSFVISIDIRRSTELMLKSRSPQDFEHFITFCCNGLSNIIQNNFGIFDKFTGDGILAFFPEFYSGEDAGLFAVKSAIECHSFFHKFYHQSRSKFNIILNNIGLGIGIDYGKTHIAKMNSYTVIGHPVVYACRLSATNNTTTLINQPGFEHLNNKYSGEMSFSEKIVNCKNEGEIVAYTIDNFNIDCTPQVPEWDSLTKRYSPKKVEIDSSS